MAPPGGRGATYKGERTRQGSTTVTGPREMYKYQLLCAGSARLSAAPHRIQLVQRQLHRRQRRLADPVVDPSPFAPSGDQPRLPENPKVMRHQRLSDVDTLLQLAHRDLAAH